MRQIKTITVPGSVSDHIKAKYCDTFFSNFKGLMFQKSIAEFEGILLVNGHESRIETSIHMFFMNFSIAVIWLDSNFKVVDTCLAKPWRPYYSPSMPARYVLEAHPNRLNDFKVGDEVTVKDE
ncbi:MAG TPA: DUF192 domain-containing protein [Longilinea sp.]|nr:DUF192 domain-containing protein [Longilinea sp.]